MIDDPPLEVTPQTEARARGLYEGAAAGTLWPCAPWDRLSNIAKNAWRRAAGSAESQESPRRSTDGA